MQDERQRWWIVVGLGNPGRRYERTRHNVGFRVIETLRKRWLADDGREAFGGRLYDVRPARPDAGSRRVLLFQPLTYMNRSGRAVAELAGFYKVAPEQMLVVVDDLNLPPGRLRARAGGSAGGQRGLADVLRSLGRQDIPRLRVGIGRPAPPVHPTDYVLSAFGEEERAAMDEAIARAADAVEDWVFRGLGFVMETYNRKPGGPEPPGGETPGRAGPEANTESDET